MGEKLIRNIIYLLLLYNEFIFAINYLYTCTLLILNKLRNTNVWNGLG